MLLKKTINKIYKISLSLFVLLTIYTIINTSTEKILRTNIEIKKEEQLQHQYIYLLSSDNYLVKSKINIEDNNIENKTILIIENLKKKKQDKELNGYLPNNLKVNSVIYENGNLKINFTDNIFQNNTNKDLIITGLTRSLLEIEEVETVEILVDNKYLKGYENPIDKKKGINEIYQINKRTDLNKVTVYYYNEINNNEYLTPVTKYLNDNREKIEIIIEELSKNIPESLISYFPNNLKLENYREENELMILNFKSNLVNNSNKINNKINKLIVESIFENYNVNAVLFQKNGEKIDYFKKKE